MKITPFLFSLWLVVLSNGRSTAQNIADPVFPISFSADAQRTKTQRNIHQLNWNGANAFPLHPNAMYEHSSQCFVARAGEEIQPALYFGDTWMSAYLYADWDKNGVLDVREPLADGRLGEGNELLSYSAYLKNNVWRNSAGQTLKNGNNSKLPAFRLPKNLKEGYYYLRFKLDWDCIAPQGNEKKGNTIVNNSGGIIDMRLRITHQENVKVAVEEGRGQLNYVEQATGEVKQLNGAVLPIGRQIAVMAYPHKGYRLAAIEVRHGMLGQTAAEGEVPVVGEDYIVVAVGANGAVVLPAGVVDGDMVVRPVYEPIGAEEGEGEHWEMVFNDEFNAPDGTLADPQKWITPQRFGATWCRFISSSPLVTHIEGNALRCRAMRNPAPGEDPVEMITGGVESRNRFSFTYGRVVVRLKTNMHRGNFPAAWMMPQTPKGGWPECGEIDIFESINSEGKAYHTIHSKWANTLHHGNWPNKGGSELLNVDQWHIYSLEWTPQVLRWYVDGREVFSYAKSTNKNHLRQGQWPFDYAYYLILNQSVGDSGWAANPDMNYVYDTYFDYVRVYQLRPNVTVGIEEVEKDKAEDDAQEVYELSGKKATNPQQGIYVVNGEKRWFD